MSSDTLACFNPLRPLGFGVLIPVPFSPLLPSNYKYIPLPLTLGVGISTQWEFWPQSQSCIRCDCKYTMVDKTVVLTDAPQEESQPPQTLTTTTVNNNAELKQEFKEPEISVIFKMQWKHESFEDVLESTGGFGLFQLLMLIVLLGPEIPASFVAFTQVFAVKNPTSWSCLSNSTDSIYGSSRNSTSSPGPGINASFDQCSCDRDSLLADDGTDSLITEWNLICEQSWIPDFITSVQMFGMLIGSLFTAQLADWYGRKITYIGLCAMMALGQGLSAMAPSAYLYAFARFLCGAGLAGFMGQSTVYPMEFLTPKWRQLCGSVGPWGEGIMLLAMIGYFVRPWRDLLWITTLPFLIVFVTVPFLPESPRYLLLNNDVEKVEKVLRTMSRVNGQKTFTTELSTLKSIALAENSSSTTTRHGYSYLFVKPNIRNKTLILSAIWFSWALVYYGLTFNIKNLRGDPYFNLFLLGVSDAIGYPAALLVNNRIGRRKSLILFMSLGAVFLVNLAGLELIYGSEVNPTLIAVLCLFGKLGTAGARSSARLLTGESFPTSVRSMGYGITGVMAGVGGILAPQLVYLGAEKWRSLPFVAFAVISVLGSVLALKLPETAGGSLQEQTHILKTGPN